MLVQFKDIYESRHENAKKWKAETGGKVLGYLCTYVPEEILYAADVLPVRILGDHKPQSVTEAHLFAMYCPFCRDCLSQGLLGKYDYLDGLMISVSCLHIRQTFSSWQEHAPVEFSYMMPMPHAVQSPAAPPFLVKELSKFKAATEKWVGRDISDSDLQKGVDIMNTNRRLLMDIYQLRKSESPPITGLESLYMVLASQTSDKMIQNELLEAVKQHELQPTRLDDRDPGTRLMIVGSEDDDVQFIEMVEQAGATIVCDDHCTGSRYFMGEVRNDSDLIVDIANRYIQRTPCPTKDWPERKRLGHILELAREFNVAGVIILQQKFCDPHECDKVPLTELLEQNGIKTLQLELDTTTPIGPFKIRVDAFLETLATDDLF